MALPKMLTSFPLTMHPVVDFLDNTVLLFIILQGPICCFPCFLYSSMPKLISCEDSLLSTSSSHWSFSFQCICCLWVGAERWGRVVNCEAPTAGACSPLRSCSQKEPLSLRHRPVTRVSSKCNFHLHFSNNWCLLVFVCLFL